MRKIGNYDANDILADAYEEAREIVLPIFQQQVKQANALAASMMLERDGTQNGAYRIVRSLFESLFNSAQAAIWVLPDEEGRDWFPWMVLRNRVARGVNNLPGWMQRLIDLNDGTIPETWTNDDVMSDQEILDEKLSSQTGSPVDRP